MNKNAIQRFAVWARTELIAQVSQRAFQYGITKDGYGEANAVALDGRVLSGDEQNQRRELVEQIRAKGYTQVMEEVAYTWFNRFIALRFMEVNNYLPSHIRVFSDGTGAFKPEILGDVLHLELPGLDKAKVAELIEANDYEALYRYLLLTQCNALNEALPRMFEKMGGFTELLLPNNILKPDSVPGRMVSDIPEEDWTDQVQIIGWLYQYYNSELKDDTFAQLKKNVKISKERIPAATQLFTPDWIVRYMVENSLGRIFVNEQLAAVPAPTEQERIAKEKEIAEKMGWKYYLPEAEQTPEVRAQLSTLTTDHSSLTTLKIIDPCMGSGHILVYAFDVLMQIYEASGYNQRDAAQSILENNLFGLDIDDRAAQLAYFAVMMKARQYDRRLFSRGIQPHIYAIMESNGINDTVVEHFISGDRNIRKNFEILANELTDAKEYGSILNISPVDFAALYARVNEIHGEISMFSKPILNRILPLVQVAEVMSQKYDVVVTNPPYMGASNMGAKLSEFVKKNYPDSKSDLFAVFIERCGHMAKKNGYQAMITQHAWMFLSSFEKLRAKILTVDIANMVHLGARAFEEIGGEVVQTTSFVIRKSHTASYKGTYCRLIEPTTQQGKEDMFLAGEKRYGFDQSNFSKIPGSPVAYWVSERFIETFSEKPIDFYFDAIIKGIFTGDNGRFLRLWAEISFDKFFVKWIPYSKGGNFRRWYGNLEYVINWENNAIELRNFSGSGLSASKYFANETIVWTKLTSYKTGFRRNPRFVFFDDASPALVSRTDDEIPYFLAFVNSSVVNYFLSFLSPTLNFQCGEIKKLPIVSPSSKYPLIIDLSNKSTQISKIDWDSYETSWDFKRNPLV